MKRCLAALLLAGGLVASAPAALLITEINSNANGGGDFWELTNTGLDAVTLSNWVWDDDSADPHDPAAVTIPSGISIASGESIVFAITSDAATFRSVWNLSSSVQVLALGGPGLGQNDAINLYDASDVLQVSLSYAANAFTRSSGLPSLGGHAGISAGGTLSSQSLIIDPTFGSITPRFTFATGSNFGSFANTSGEFGSPGFSGLSVVPEPGSVALITLGLGFLGWQTRRRFARA